MSKSIFDLHIKLRRMKNPMNDVLKFCAVDVEQLVCGYNFHISHQKGWVELGIGDPTVDVSDCDTDLVQNLPVLSNKRMVGLAAQDVNCAAGLIAIFAFAGKQRPGSRVSNASARFILVKCPLKRAAQQVALRS